MALDNLRHFNGAWAGICLCVSGGPGGSTVCLIFPVIRSFDAKTGFLGPITAILMGIWGRALHFYD